jgi:cob(I)alamin adenosyltransferase
LEPSFEAGESLSQRNPSRDSLSSVRSKKGLVQVFTGEGRGKTSAALGSVVRAAGHGFKVFIAVFMKGDYPYSEWIGLSRFPEVTVKRFGPPGFTNRDAVKPEEKEQAQQALAAAREAVFSGKYEMVVMDEVNVASAWKLISVEDVVNLIKEKPENIDMILTGRYADSRITAAADLVTECTKIKHPYDRGVKSRAGIDF